jgi:hypothetical protein
MNENNINYGPLIIFEKKSTFYFRKFKREFTYCIIILTLVILCFTVPLLSYECFKDYLIAGKINLFNSIRTVGKSVLTMGAIYSLISAYFMYIPKENYWAKLEQERIFLETQQQMNIEPTKKGIKEKLIQLRE